MPVWRTQIVLDHDTGLPENVAVNTIYLDTASDLAVEFDNARDSIERFYETASVGANAIQTYLSAFLAGTATVKFYNMADPTPRQLFASRTFSFTPAATFHLPPEVAVVTSFHAEYASGNPNARRRGRLYIGPLATTALNAATPGLVDPTFQDVLVASTERLQSELQADNIEWVIYSEVDNAFRAVVGGWVDNAWDTQRRRGLPATVRDQWVV